MKDTVTISREEHSHMEKICREVEVCSTAAARSREYPVASPAVWRAANEYRLFTVHRSINRRKVLEETPAPPQAKLKKRGRGRPKLLTKRPAKKLRR